MPLQMLKGTCRMRMSFCFIFPGTDSAKTALTLREEYGDKLILVGDSCRPGQIYDALHSGHDKAFVYC